MLHQNPDTFCDIVLGKKLKRIRVIISNIPNHYDQFIKYKTDSQGNKIPNKPKYVNALGQYWVRTLNPPKKELKQIQKKINKYLVQNIQLPRYAHGAVKGLDNIKNAKVHKGQKYVFQTDIRDFFPSISYTKVYDALIISGFSPDVASLITKLTTLNHHLPQGAPTSPFLANLVFTSTGNKIQKIADMHNLRFTTFVDDVTLSSQTDFKHIIPQIIGIIKNSGYKISHGKTSYKSGITEITGVRLPNNSMTITNKFREKIENTVSLSEASLQGMINYKDRIKQLSQK